MPLRPVPSRYSTVPIAPLVAGAMRLPKATAGAMHAKKRKGTTATVCSCSPSVQSDEYVLDLRRMSCARPTKAGAYRPSPFVGRGLGFGGFERPDRSKLGTGYSSLLLVRICDRLRTRPARELGWNALPVCDRLTKASRTDATRGAMGTELLGPLVRRRNFTTSLCARERQNAALRRTRAGTPVGTGVPNAVLE
eukprot:scaffold848_cov247-Pinguiococcus_pyrenoidosus.AAC.22